jgi:RecB family exonuclease
MVSPVIASGPSGIEDSDENEAQQEELFHPDDFGPIQMPKHLSPSSAMAFKECPQSFLFQYLYKIKQPTNQVLAKGSMCHSALEHIFDLDPDERTLENLQNLLRVEWAENRLEGDYKLLFETDDDEGDGAGRDIEAEREWGQSALQLLENYYESEDPRIIQRPNPHKREVWVNANLAVDPTMGVTAKKHSAAETPSSKPETFKVRGIIDRLDIVRESSRKVALKVIDYKTGKAPNLKYSPAMNQKIFREKFYQLKIYALLMREKTEASSNDKKDSMDLRYLKLHFLNSEDGRAKPWEMDLGETQEIRDEELHEVHRDLSRIWMDIRALVDTQDPKAFEHCDRSFCYCHKCRDRFVPGTVWQRPVSD